jgi:PKD repeat protein
VYPVTLNVTDAAGNWATDTIVLTVVVGIPTADAGLDQVVDEDTMITFNGSASWDKQGLATYTWTLIDSTIQTLNGSTHSYIFTNPGNFSVTLTVNDSHGTEATDTTQVTVLDVTQPEASITCNQTVTQGVALQISAENSTDNGQITHYTWDFGDDTQGTGIATNHIYATPGDYTIVLTLTDGGGNIATTQQLVTVLPNEGGIGLMTWLPILIIPGVLLVLILKRMR